LPVAACPGAFVAVVTVAFAVAATAVAAVETEEEEEARTVDVVAHGARAHGAHDASELLPLDVAVAHWPTTR
jgi:ammonia channel protein AmtB